MYQGNNKAMSKYDFAQRLQRMVHKECDIIKAETKVVQKSADHYEKLSFVETTLIKQEQQLLKYCKEVAELENENEQIEKFKQQEEDHLCELIRKVEQMQLAYQQALQQHTKERRTALLQMDCVRNIKLVTQTYINLNALPELIQGVTIKEKETSSEWKPFRIDNSKHMQKEVENLIWDDSRTDSVHKETWEKLILYDILHDENQWKKTKTRNGNVNVTKY